MINGLPRSLSGKETTYQSTKLRRCRLDPQIGKIIRRRKWQPTPVFLPGESHGQRSLLGYNPWSHKETDTIEHPCMDDNYQLLSSWCFCSIYQFSPLAQSCPTLCDPMDCKMPGFPVHHQFPEVAQTHVHQVGDAIPPSHPLLSPSPPALILAQHQGLFQGVSSSYQLAKVLEFQLSLSPFNEYSGSTYAIILLQYLFSLHCIYLFTCWPLLLIYKLPEGRKHALFVLSASTQHNS